MLEKKRISNKLYYQRKKGITELTEEQKEQKLREAAQKKLASYERQKERQKQQRLERGHKPLGRPYQKPENKIHNMELLKQLEELDKLD